jgi:hypothetical protein
LALAAMFLAPALRADSVPDWFRELAKAPLPSYSPETNAVVLLDQETVTVKDANDITVTHRWAAKILRPDGRGLGIVGVPFGKDTRVTYLKGWSIAANGQEYTMKESDSVDTGAFESFELFADDRVKAMRLPAAEPGAFVAYEFVQKSHPYVLEKRWEFQNENPVRTSRLTLALPAGWQYDDKFANMTEIKPRSTGPNQWTWELTDLPGYEPERYMPDPAAINGQIVVHFYSPVRSDQGTSSWQDIGRWYNRLNSSRQVSTPGLHARVAQLTSGKSDPVDKIRVLAEFIQNEIRYVAIAIGIGGYQAHLAGDIFTNRYGDCKDKATLLATMLKDAGIDSFLLYVNTDQGVVKPEIPSVEFDHAILAIKLPDGINTDKLYAVVDDKKAGKLLIFDPTDTKTPLGSLSPDLQGSYGLVSLPDGGELIKLPSLAPSLNRLVHVGHLELLPDGTLKGNVQEILKGHFAADGRAALSSQTTQDRTKLFEYFLAGSLSRYEITNAEIKNLDRIDQPLTLNYSFESPGYAQTVGGLLLVRPRVLGQKAWAVAEGKPRKFPVEFPDGTSSEMDTFDITMPPGVVLDELPSPVDAIYDFAEYHSHISVKDGVLHYDRTYTQKDVAIPMEKMDQFKDFMRKVGGDERSTAVLKRVAGQ